MRAVNEIALEIAKNRVRFSLSEHMFMSGRYLQNKLKLQYDNIHGRAQHGFKEIIVT